MQHSRKAATWAAVAGVLTYMVAINVRMRLAVALPVAWAAPGFLLFLSYPVALVAEALVTPKVRHRVR